MAEAPDVMVHPRIDHAGTQAGTDDAGTPRPALLLTALLGGGVAWSLHLLGSYVLVAFSCTTGWGGGRVALAAMSLVALGATGGSGWLAWRRWRVARAVDRPEDDAWDARMGERTARVSFLMVVGLVSAMVFAVGIVYATIAIWIGPLCEAGVVT